MLLLEEHRAEFNREHATSVQMFVGGMVDPTTRRPIQILDATKERDAFEKRLTRPLGWERERAEMLRMVAEA